MSGSGVSRGDLGRQDVGQQDVNRLHMGTCAVVTPPVLGLLAAIAWSTATLGGTRGVDLAVVSALLVVALVQTRPTAADVRELRRSPVTIGVALLVGWTALVGLAEAGMSTTTMRVPWLLVLGALAASVVLRLDARERQALRIGLAFVGTVIAASAVFEVVSGAVAEGIIGRAASIIGYPNAAGVVLVATVAVTIGLVARRELPAHVGGVAVALQTLGVLATGSRLAIGVALALLTGVAWRRRSPLPAAGALALAVPMTAVLVVRFATSPPERLGLWRAALDHIAANPLTGHGPSPTLLTSGLADARPTTHAHSELIQLTVEYGVVGLALVLLAVGAAIWTLLRRHRVADVFAAVGSLAIGAAALTDFSLRITSVALVVAVLLPMGWRPRGEVPTADARPEAVERRPSPAATLPARSPGNAASDSR